MSEKTSFKCDVCGHAITEGHQQLYMVVVKTKYTTYDPNDSTSNARDIYHVHNDLSKHCMQKLWSILEKHKQ